MQFKLGDVVYLKSGGPAMTFSELTGAGHIIAWWFTDDDGPFQAAFEPEMLELAADEDGFYDAKAEYDAVYAKRVNGGELTAEEWEIFQTAGARGHNEDLSDAELDAIIADYERDRGR